MIMCQIFDLKEIERVTRRGSLACCMDGTVPAMADHRSLKLAWES